MVHGKAVRGWESSSPLNQARKSKPGQKTHGADRLLQPSQPSPHPTKAQISFVTARLLSTKFKAMRLAKFGAFFVVSFHVKATAAQASDAVARN